MYELIYRSFARGNLNQSDITDILETARDFNAKNNITGCLLYYGDEFIQILEGEEQMVQDLYSRICRDHRHTNVILLEESEKETRTFKEWTMAFHELNDDDAKYMSKELFIKNFVTFSEIAEKNTFATVLFWNLAKRLLLEHAN